MAEWKQLQLQHQIIGGGYSHNVQIQLAEDGIFTLSHTLSQMGGCQINDTITGTYIKDDSYMCLTATNFNNIQMKSLRFELILFDVKKKMHSYDPLVYDVFSMNGGDWNFDYGEFDAILLHNPSQWEKVGIGCMIPEESANHLVLLRQLKLLSDR